MPAPLYSPRYRVFILRPHSLPSFLLSRSPAALIVSDNPSTKFSPPQNAKQKTKNPINKMKILKIGTKTQANKILLDSLFNPVNGKTLNKMKYCNGKYKPGSFIGREIEVGDDVHALFTESRKDSDGPYVRLMCITE
jgi:hypothetical protein